MPVIAIPRLQRMLNKVPEVTAVFWIIKIISTTVGETGADYLAVHVGLGAIVTAANMAILLAAALALQLRARRYVPWIYWLTVVLVSVVGTEITDLLTDKLEISLYISTAAFACALAATFAIWYGVERTLSIHTIVTQRRELFYWLAILFTFALGTAAGDLATEALGLGFQLGVIVFGALIALIAAAWHFGANPVLTFWLAYILTRPLGASLGDLLSQSRGYGGVGLGTIYTSIAFLTVIIALVIWLTFEGDRAGSATISNLNVHRKPTRSRG
ncbi:putative membrane-anchored protein [Bradyrhizobium sp. AZCC 2289]